MMGIITPGPGAGFAVALSLIGIGILFVITAGQAIYSRMRK